MLDFGFEFKLCKRFNSVALSVVVVAEDVVVVVVKVVDVVVVVVVVVDVVVVSIQLRSL